MTLLPDMMWNQVVKKGRRPSARYVRPPLVPLTEEEKAETVIDVPEKTMPVAREKRPCDRYRK